MNLKKIVMTIGFLGFATAGFADETCYQLSRDGKAWSKTPESICVSTRDESENVMITLKTGLTWEEKTVATFNLELIESLRCGPNCNGNIYGLSNPSNSLFNELKISFNGLITKNSSGQEVESGTVDIGKNRFFYMRAE